MEKRLENYLTEEEKECMDQIVSKAMKRRGESGGNADGMLPFEFAVVNCQCQNVQNEKEKLNHMLEDMCQCIRQHGCCPREDEQLPF